MIRFSISRRICRALLICFFTTAVVPVQAQNTMAILDFQALGIPQNDAVVLTSRLRSLLVQSGPYTVIEREQMIKILQEQDFQMTGCTSSECAVEVGQILSAQLILTGEIGKLSNYVTLDARIIDVETSKIGKTFSWDKSGGTVGSLLREGIPYIADQIRNISGLGAGNITILTDPPGASIIFDGIEHPNKTPAIINNIPPGSHEILLSRYMDNYGEVEIKKEVSITPNKTLTINEEFKKYMTFGALLIYPTPNNIRLSMHRTRVAAGGRESGQSYTISSYPVKLDNLAAGQYTIKLYNDNYEREVSVPVGPNQTTRVDLSLFKKTLDTRKKLGDPGYKLRSETKTIQVSQVGARLFVGLSGTLLWVVYLNDDSHLSPALASCVLLYVAMHKMSWKYNRKVADEINIAYNKEIKSKLAEYNTTVYKKNQEIRRYNSSLPEPKITIQEK